MASPYRPKKILVGVTFSGDQKYYVLEKFLEMADACIRPHADILWVGQRNLGGLAGDKFIHMEHPNDYTEDILMIAREEQRKYALANGYDKLVWQGVDCLYQSSSDFKDLIDHDLPVVGALTCARNNSSHAVAAQYCRTEPSYANDDPNDNWTKDYYNFTDEVLNSGNVIPAGIPGADAMCLDRTALDLSWVGSDHVPWYTSRERGEPELSCESWYTLELMRRGQSVWLDTYIKTWHVHEDCIARQWKGIEKPLAELSWSY